MADFNTRYKLYPHRYIHTSPSKGAFTLRDHYREFNSQTYKSAGRDQLTVVLPSLAVLCYPVHDCRNPIVKDHQNTHRWDSLILSYGLDATCDSVTDIHIPPPKSLDEIRPDKLLFHIGNGVNNKGSAPGEFNWPRSLAVSNSGEIVIADTLNHRVQAFNQYGVLVKKFGQYGTKDGEFNEPTGVAITMNDEVIVADSKNKRIQVFTRHKVFKDSFKTNDEPISVATDIYYNTIVATKQRTIEIYRRGGKMVNRFRTFPVRELNSDVHTQVAVNELMNTIIVCDIADRLIKQFNYSGDLLSKFEPIGALDGLACIPGGISILLNGNICITDILNHTVSLYSDKGLFLKQLVGPTDGCGSVQQCAIGPEGHLITTEYSVNNIHCLKIYRYKDCECHRYRPGSSKRPDTPNIYQVRRHAEP